MGTVTCLARYRASHSTDERRSTVKRKGCSRSWRFRVAEMLFFLVVGEGLLLNFVASESRKSRVDRLPAT